MGHLRVAHFYMEILMDLLLDFETYSEAKLKEVGARRYVMDPSFRPLCLAWKAFDPITLKSYETGLWKHEDATTPDLNRYDNYWAFNASFDFLVNFYCNENFGLPQDIRRWKDVQVVMAKFSLPQDLHTAAEVLQTPIQKHYDGPLIISRCCKKNSRTPTSEDYHKLYTYCVQDVDATFEVYKAAPGQKISDDEWELWRQTFKMNFDGLPIDFEAVDAIQGAVESYQAVVKEMLPEVTNGRIRTPNQHAKIKQYLRDHGVMVENTTKETIEELVTQDDNEPFLPENCRTLLDIRQACGASSVAKFKKLQEMQVNGRVHDFIRYGATNTLRWAGAGFQVHSLPKASVADPDGLIDRFLNNDHIENPIKAAKALCRAVIKAPPGQLIYQNDFSSIEYLLLIWITDMTEQLTLFKEGKSAYIDMAAYLFNKRYEDIDKHAIDNLEYFLGKQVILGCGYQMGHKKFRETCKKYGVEIAPKLAQFAVDGYRRKYKPISNFWDGIHKACVRAVKYPNQEELFMKCKVITRIDHRGTPWLVITLPSNSRLFYAYPEIDEGHFGPELRHMGLNKFNWVHRYLSPGRITENIIQKLARDLMAHSILEVSKDPDFKILMQVHDELVCLSSELDPKYHLARLGELMTRKPAWAKDLPLRSGGYYSTRYKKD
jgi:hypothetical protein